MDTIGILNTIIEFSQKGEELSDEQKSLGITCSSLLETFKDLDPSLLPKQLHESLQDHLNESKQLIQYKYTSTSKIGALIQNFKSMMPGSILQQIKEKNQKLIELASLISVHLQAKSALTSTKQISKQNSQFDVQEKLNDINSSIDKVKRVKTASSNEMLGNFQTINQNLFEPTLVQQDEEDLQQFENQDQICSLQAIGNEVILQKLKQNQTQDLLEIKIFWSENQKSNENLNNQILYQIKREHYICIPDTAKIFSRIHASIYGKKNQNINQMNSPLKVQEFIIAPTLPQTSQLQTQEIFQTLAEADEFSYLDEIENHIQKKPVEFFVEDSSMNGTYLLKFDQWPSSDEKNYGQNIKNIIQKKQEWQKLEKGKLTKLENGDIIGLTIDKKSLLLTIGYKFTTNY